MRIILTAISFIFTASVWGQLQFLPDTMTYKERIGGSIDSVDISNAKSSSIFDGGKEIYGFNALNAGTLARDLRYHVLLPDDNNEMPIRFSALPHIGFAYSIGSQTTQFLRTSYQQAFSQNLLLNLDYKRNSSEGYLRNSVYSDNDLKLRLDRKGDFYSFSFKGFYTNARIQHPGGITTDELIIPYGLEFTPVYKQSANDTINTGGAQLTNYFDITKDSTFQLGIITEHKFRIINRVYHESDTLYGIYQQINIDSVKTRDQYNNPSIENGGGVFISKSNDWYTDFVFSHRYWDLQNLGLHRDTTELYLNNRILGRIGRLRMSNRLRYNISGAYNGLEEHLSFQYRSGKYNAHVDFDYENLPPQVMNRVLFANNYNYSITNLQKNVFSTGRLGGSVQLVDSVLKLGGDLTFASVSNQYYFDGYNWRNDTLQNYSFGSVDLKASLTLKALNIRTTFRYAFDPGSYLPEIQEYTRLYLKGRLFKAKKLEALFGVEQEYISSYRRRSYFTNSDLFNWFASNGDVPSMVNLHGFINLGIDEFRFYVRFENIGYYWNDQRTQLLSGYPLMGTRLRLGITWDFFN